MRKNILDAGPKSDVFLVDEIHGLSYPCVLANILNIEQNNITLVKLKYTFILIDVKITTVKNPICYSLSLKCSS